VVGQKLTLAPWLLFRRRVVGHRSRIFAGWSLQFIHILVLNLIKCTNIQLYEPFWRDCVDLVKDCKKVTSIHFFYLVRKSSQNKENRMAMATMAMYLSCSIALISNYMHKIEQTSIGAISVICQNSVSMRRLF